MRKQYENALRIELTKTGVAVVRTSGWWQTHSEVLVEWVGSEAECAAPETVINQLSVLLKELDCARMPASIVLPDSWVRRWMVVPPQNAASLADCQAAARVRFQVLFGEALTDWHLAADWDARQPFLAYAIPHSLWAALLHVATERRLVLLEITPHFVAAWNIWRKQLQAGVWFGVMQHKVLTYAVLGQQGVQFVREVVLPDEALRDQHRVAEILAREALRLNVPMPLEIRLCGQIPMHWVMSEHCEMREIAKLVFVNLDQHLPAHHAQPAAASVSTLASLASTGRTP